MKKTKKRTNQVTIPEDERSARGQSKLGTRLDRNTTAALDMCRVPPESVNDCVRRLIWAEYNAKHAIPAGEPNPAKRTK